MNTTPKAAHIEKGEQGEQEALNYLEKKSYKLLQRNYRSGKGEIDLIMEDGKYLVFIEVRYRKSAYFGHPEQSISKSKIRLLLETSTAYMRQNKLNPLWVRFDVISILECRGELQIDHFKDAIH